MKDCPNDGKNYTLCRKVYQNGKSNAIGKKIIWWKNFVFLNYLIFLVRGDERVIRSCGYEEKYSSDGEKRECYNTVLEEYNTYVCTCEGDGCNGSASIKFSIFTIVCTTILAMFFK